MKKITAFTFILILIFSVKVIADIRYTHHDFSYWYWVYPQASNPNQEICVFCHTPHNAMSGLEASNAPLWNHEITGAAYALYTSNSLNASIGTPGGISKLCLSCHDGTVAVDSHSGMSGSVYLGPSGSGFGHEGGYIGTNLSDDHPISFVYDAGLAATDGGLRDPSVTPSGLPGGGTIAETMLFDGKLECSSCHDVHVPRNNNEGGNCWGCHVIDGQWSTPPKKPSLSLRIGNENSALCLSCHVK